MLLSLWYSDYAERFFSEMRKAIKKRKNLWYCTAGKVVRDKKLEEYENENYSRVSRDVTSFAQISVRHVGVPRVSNLG